MQTPRGFVNKYGQEVCLKLTCSLYDSKFAPQNWYVHLQSALLKLGLCKSPIDKCLFYYQGLLLLLFIDDAGISAPKRDLIDEFVAELRALGLELDIEDDFNCYLGIGIEILPDGTCHMT